MRVVLGGAANGIVVRRALKYALVVGALLLAINHGDAIVRGDLSAGRLIRMALTMLVPYAVSTLSSLEAMAETRNLRDPEHEHKR